MSPLLFSVLLLASDPSAADASATSNPAEQAVPAKKEKKICRIDPANTGSRMPKKFCLSQVEWEKHNAGRSAGDLETVGAR
jgi:hypothetical protein